MLHRPALNEFKFTRATNNDAALPLFHETVAHASAAGRLHGGVALSVFAIFGYMFAVIWMTFRADLEASFMVAISTVYLAMYFGTPLIMTRAGGFPFFDGTRWNDFLESRLDTFTGPLTGRQAWIQICMIPAALALATTGICLIIVMTT